MSALQTNGQDDPDTDTSHSDAMKDQLRGDVASWMATRAEAGDRGVAETTVTPVRGPAPKPVAKAKQSKPVPAASVADPVKKKPFGMSYDGMSQADYITYMISRGAR